MLKGMSCRIMCAISSVGMGVVFTSSCATTKGGAQSGKSEVSGMCGKSPMVGAWKTSQGDTITFREDCSGISVACRSRFNYPAVNGNSGIVKINILEKDGPDDCLTVGEHSCSYSVTGDEGSINCGGAPFSIKRI